MSQIEGIHEQKIRCLKTRVIKLTKDKPLSIFMKSNQENEIYNEVLMHKRKRLLKILENCLHYGSLENQYRVKSWQI